MNIRTLALVLGSAMVVAASGMAATACSSSTNGGSSSSSGGADASHGDTGSSSGSSSGGSSGSSSGSSGDDGGGSSGGEAGPDCGSIPSLHTTEAGTIYCGFSGDAGLDCPTGQQCCLGGSLGGGQFAPEQCAKYGSTCTNGAPDGSSPPVAIECAQISDCTANGNTKATACCLQGATLSTVAGCSYPKYSHGTAIVCEGTGGPGAATACASGETQICASDTDCPSTAPHCTAGKWKIFQLGFCGQ